MNQIEFNGQRLSIEDVTGLSRREFQAKLSSAGSFIKRIEAGAGLVDEVLEERGKIYGVTTWYGDSCEKTIPPDHYANLPINLTRFHGCGLGTHFDAEATRAIIAVRLQSLCLGYSGVSYNLLQGLERLLKNDILPLIPQEGSVGASGDLTPLSYVAAALIGEREVFFKGKTRPALEVWQSLHLPPLKLRPKEGLAVMNGTAAMTALACLAFERAEQVASLACRLTSLASLVLKGNTSHFSERLFTVKPHPGQILVAKRIRLDLDGQADLEMIPERIQDPYSIRCAPHVIGVFYDTAPLFRQIIENELNSANDNPIIDPENRQILHGGHFYGGHIAFVMDSLKIIIANLADLLDRQLALLVDQRFNRGLPSNLSGSDNSSCHHGFKAVQIGVSAWTAEALKNTMPASVFSRSTECHNQDKVSMGTIAARDCIRVLELTEQVTAACLLAVAQAVRLRQRENKLFLKILEPVQATLDQVFVIFPFLEEDRPLEKELRRAVREIRSGNWRPSYAE